MSEQTRVTGIAFHEHQRITRDGFEAVDRGDINTAPPACEHQGCPASGFRTVREYQRHLEDAHDGQRAEARDGAVGAPAGDNAVDTEVDA